MSIEQMFKELLPFKWAFCSFPVSEMSIDLSQDIAEHKYWGKDGARLEATGRAPLVFTAKIPFRNGIFPGRGEQWAPSILYPDGYRAFLSAMADRTTRELQHPELGVIKCKPVSCKTNWSGGRRDGVDVDATWKETTEDGEESAIERDSPATGYVEAGELDGHLSSAELRKLAPKMPAYTPDLADTMRSIASFGDTISVFQKRATGRIDSLAYKVDRIAESMEGARNALTWPVDLAAMRLADSLTRLRKELVASGRALVLYTVPVASTLGAIAPQLGVPIEELLRLNPHLGRSLTVRGGRVVKYFAKKNT